MSEFTEEKPKQTAKQAPRGRSPAPGGAAGALDGPVVPGFGGSDSGAAPGDGERRTPQPHPQGDLYDASGGAQAKPTEGEQCKVRQPGWAPRKGETLHADNTPIRDVGGVKRILLDGLSSVAGSQRAVVAIPGALHAELQTKKDPKEVEFLIHLHGFYSHGYHGGRDESVYRIEQQIAARRMIAILPQGDTKAMDYNDPKKAKKDYGEKISPPMPNGDALILEVLQHLYCRSDVPRGTTVLSGFSAGGGSVIQALNDERNLPSKLGEVILFEGIYQEGEEEGPRLRMLKKYVKGQLDNARDEIERLRDKQAAEKDLVEVATRIPRLRGFFHKRSTYGPPYKALKKAVDAWFNNPKNQEKLGGKGSAAYGALHDRFDPDKVAKEVADQELPGEDGHESVMGAGDHLKEALGDLDPPLAKGAPGR